MDRKILVDKMIEAGKLLVSEMDRSDLVFNAVMWLYDEGSEEYKFIIATPMLRLNGPKRMYDELYKIVLKSGQVYIRLEDVVILDSRDEIIKTIGSAIQTGPEDISGIRMSKSMINGFYIEDIFIYRISKKSNQKSI